MEALGRISRPGDDRHTGPCGAMRGSLPECGEQLPADWGHADHCPGAAWVQPTARRRGARGRADRPGQRARRGRRGDGGDAGRRGGGVRSPAGRGHPGLRSDEPDEDPRRRRRRPGRSRSAACWLTAGGPGRLPMRAGPERPQAGVFAARGEDTRWRSHSRESCPGRGTTRRLRRFAPCAPRAAYGRPGSKAPGWMPGRTQPGRYAS